MMTLKNIPALSFCGVLGLVILFCAGIFGLEGGGKAGYDLDGGRPGEEGHSGIAVESSTPTTPLRAKGARISRQGADRLLVEFVCRHNRTKSPACSATIRYMAGLNIGQLKSSHGQLFSKTKGGRDNWNSITTDTCGRAKIYVKKGLFVVYNVSLGSAYAKGLFRCDADSVVHVVHVALVSPIHLKVVVDNFNEVQRPVRVVLARFFKNKYRVVSQKECSKGGVADFGNIQPFLAYTFPEKVEYFVYVPVVSRTLSIKKIPDQRSPVVTVHLSVPTGGGVIARLNHTSDLEGLLNQQISIAISPAPITGNTIFDNFDASPFFRKLHGRACLFPHVGLSKKLYAKARNAKGEFLELVPNCFQGLKYPGEVKEVRLSIFSPAPRWTFRFIDLSGNPLRGDILRRLQLSLCAHLGCKPLEVIRLRNTISSKGTYSLSIPAIYQAKDYKVRFSVVDPKPMQEGGHHYSVLVWPIDYNKVRDVDVCLSGHPSNLSGHLMGLGKYPLRPKVVAFFPPGTTPSVCCSQDDRLHVYTDKQFRFFLRTTSRALSLRAFARGFFMDRPVICSPPRHNIRLGFKRTFCLSWRATSSLVPSMDGLTVTAAVPSSYVVHPYDPVCKLTNNGTFRILIPLLEQVNLKLLSGSKVVGSATVKLDVAQRAYTYRPISVNFID